MMFLTELLVILLFLLVFLSYNFFTEEAIPDMGTFYILFVGSFLFYAFTVPFAFGIKFSYYDFVYLYCLDIVHAEYYFFFFFFFVYYPTVTVYVATLLGIFSILFICIYFSIKRVQQTSDAIRQSVSILRKQNFVRQALKKPQVQTFQR